MNLAVSLHAPVQELRCQIMPAARAFPLERLMEALGEYQKKRYGGALSQRFCSYIPPEIPSSEVIDHQISYSILLLSQQKIFIEYIMLAGVNDEEEHAHQLGKLLDTFQVVSFLCIPC